MRQGETRENTEGCAMSIMIVGGTYGYRMVLQRIHLDLAENRPYEPVGDSSIL